jgi:thioredoxin reductase (NADPH)
MTKPAPTIQPTLATPADQTFPTLTPGQVARVEARGRVRQVQAGEVLVEAGDQVVPFFLVKSGRLEIVRSSGAGETLVAAEAPGQFTGEVNMLSGRPALFRIRAAEPGEVIELDREHVLALVQTDNELGEIIILAFILRRVELVAQGVGDVVVVGSMHCAGTLRVREFLTRNGHPYSFIDLGARRHHRDRSGISQAGAL